MRSRFEPTWLSQREYKSRPGTGHSCSMARIRSREENGLAFSFPQRLPLSVPPHPFTKSRPSRPMPANDLLQGRSVVNEIANVRGQPSWLPLPRGRERGEGERDTGNNWTIRI